MENNNIANNNSEQEIDFLAIALRLWEKRKFIIKITSIFVVLGLIVAITSPKEYNAGCVFVPQVGSKSSGGSLGSLAALAGISIGSVGEGEVLSPRIYDKVLNNIDLQKDLIYTPIHWEGYSEPISIIDYYTKPEYRKFSLIGVIKKYTIGLPGVIIGAIKGKPKEELGVPASDSIKLKMLTQRELICLKAFRGRYNLNIEEKKGYITVNANMPEPLAAAEVAQRILDLLQQYVTEFKIQKAKANYDFIKSRYEEARVDFEHKQDEYARFRDANRSLTTAVSRVKEEQIREEFSVANSLFTELTRQMVQAEIKVKEDTPILTVVEPVVVPREKSKPSRPKILFGFIFFGVVVACGSVIGLDWLKEKNLRLKFVENWK